MQGSMDGEMGVMGKQVLVLRGGFPLHHRRANDRISTKKIGIAGQHIGIVIYKSQHVGGVILATVIFVQLAPLGLTHDAQRHAHIVLQCGLDPAAQLCARRHDLCVAGVLHGQGKFMGRSLAHRLIHSEPDTSSPRKVWRTTCVIFTWAKRPIMSCNLAISGNPAISGEPGKFTTRLLSVRPANSCVSFFDTPSTSTRCVVPSIDCATTSSCSIMRSCKRFRRAAFTSCGVSSRNSAAGVPGRGLYR